MVLGQVLVFYLILNNVQLQCSSRASLFFIMPVLLLTSKIGSDLRKILRDEISLSAMLRRSYLWNHRGGTNNRSTKNGKIRICKVRCTFWVSIERYQASATVASGTMGVRFIVNTQLIDNFNTWRCKAMTKWRFLWSRGAFYNR